MEESNNHFDLHCPCILKDKVDRARFVCKVLHIYHLGITCGSNHSYIKAEYMLPAILCFPLTTTCKSSASTTILCCSLSIGSSHCQSSEESCGQDNQRHINDNKNCYHSDDLYLTKCCSHIDKTWCHPSDQSTEVCQACGYILINDSQYQCFVSRWCSIFFNCQIIESKRVCMV